MLRRGTLAGGAAGVAYVAADENRRQAVPNTWHGVVRFARTVKNFAATVVDYKVSFYQVDKQADRATFEQVRRTFSERAALRLLHVCHENGGIYTKFGQTVANMNNVLPQEIIDTLAPLQDKAKEMTFANACKVVREDLGRPLEEVFSSFEKEPVAAASLAQVHRAVLRDSGEEVAVKLQYSHLDDQVKGDTATIEMLARFVGFWFPEFSYTWIIPEFKNNMVLELDFIQEAKNAQRLAKMFAHKSDVYVPKVNWEYTTKRMLTMEFIQGFKVNNVEAMEQEGIHPLDVARTVSTVFGDMIHVHGFVHCDPHPGNLFIRRKKLSPWQTIAGYVETTLKGVADYAFAFGSVSLVSSLHGMFTLPGVVSLAGLYGFKFLGKALASSLTGGGMLNRGNAYELVVLDHGMYRRLDPSFRENYCELWRSLLLRDVDRGIVAAQNLGVNRDLYETLALVFTYRRPSSTGKTGARISKAERMILREKYKNVTAGDVNEFLRLLPRDILFVLRSTNIVRSINLSLGGTTRQRFKIMGESAVRGILIPNPSFTVEEIDTTEKIEGPYCVNLPVSSEIVRGAADTMTWNQYWEVLRLRLYLSMIDSNWGVLNFFAGFLRAL